MCTELVSGIRYKLACAYTEDSNQSARSQSDQSYLHWTFGYTIERPLKTLISVRECAG